MTVYIEFHLDTRTSNETIKIQSAYAELGQTRDNLYERLKDTGSGKTAMMSVRDADTGKYVFVNTMKLANVNIYEVEEE